MATRREFANAGFDLCQPDPFAWIDLRGPCRSNPSCRTMNEAELDERRRKTHGRAVLSMAGVQDSGD